jgi:hypothetical protein
MLNPRVLLSGLLAFPVLAARAEEIAAWSPAGAK